MAKRIEKPAAKTKQTGKHTDGSKSVQRKSKVGSDRAAAGQFAGGGDFGIPAEGAGRFHEVAEEAKYQAGGDHLSDPRPPRRGGDGPRESGVRSMDAGPGSSSGDDAAAGEISQGEAAGDDNTDIDNMS